MKKLCSLIITTALFVPMLVLAGEETLESHPFFSEENWTLVRFSIDFKEDTIMESYENNDGNYLMIIDKYFGETVIRRFINRKIGSVSQTTWYQVEIQGRWRTVAMKNLEFDQTYDSSGRRTAVIIIVNDDNGREIVRRVITRKSVSIDINCDNVNNSLTQQEKEEIDRWIAEKNLNKYGDSKDEIYTGGSPLFNEASGQCIDRYDYILKNNWDRPWRKN